ARLAELSCRALSFSSFQFAKNPPVVDTQASNLHSKALPDAINFIEVLASLALDFKINRHNAAGISALRLINTGIVADNTGCHPDHHFIEFLSPATLNSVINTALALNSLFNLC